MNFEKVDGRNAGDIRLYALSTCIWCKKTRVLLEELGVEFEFIYIDLISGDEKTAAVDEVEKFNPRVSFPTLVIDGEVIVGFKEDRVREILE
ncbi:MAG: glutaredoxin family protein [bacterium]